jgi:hypothetical protein
MYRPTAPLLLMVLVAFMCGQAYANDDFEFSGDIRTRYSLQTFPDNSLLRELAGSKSQDVSVVTRLKFAYDTGNWDLRADYQFIYLHGDRIEYTRQLPPEVQLLGRRLPDDRTRLFDLTSVIKDEGKTAVLHRLDRLSVGYTGRKSVVRFGRQAITWGNGMIYTPMDIFNPFDPAAVDTEYKAGDDMLYGQYLRDGGDDLQAVAVFRRNLVTGDFEAADSSLAFKYHRFGGTSEYDLLAALHYEEPLLGIGGNTAVGGAVWRGDVTLAFTNEDVASSKTGDVIASLVTSLSYSWTWGGKNVSGVAEYFFNGFGQRDGNYDPASLAANPELLERIVRGELFTLGRHYVAVSTMVEVTPLFLMTPNLFVNLSDGSALLQLVTQNDLKENFVLLGALNVPVGPDGTEFGGIATGVPGQYLSSDLSLFVQLAWYF